jgi:propanol-preferring alcohol dehydrogenase
VQEIGAPDPAKPVLGIHIGQRVGIPWLHNACGSCPACHRGEENLCPLIRFTGFHVPGGYADAMLADARYCLPLPEAMDDLQAAPLLCAGIVGYRSMKIAGLQPGEHLGLFGFGASGHLVLQVARYWGCPVSVFTRSLNHQEHALDLGADWASTADQTPPTPLDRAIIFAPSGALVPLALEKLRPGGTLALNAIYMSPIPEMPYSILYGERTLRSVANATYKDGLEFLEIAARIPLAPGVVPYPLAEANRALEDLKYSRIRGEAVLAVKG